MVNNQNFVKKSSLYDLIVNQKNQIGCPKKYRDQAPKIENRNPNIKHKTDQAPK